MYVRWPQHVDQTCNIRALAGLQSAPHVVFDFVISGWLLPQHIHLEYQAVRGKDTG